MMFYYAKEVMNLGDNINFIFADNFRKNRNNANISISSIEFDLGIDHKTIKNIEMNKTKIKASNAIKLYLYLRNKRKTLKFIDLFELSENL